MSKELIDSIIKIENKDHIEQAINHIESVISQISIHTTTWNYLNEALTDLKIVLGVVYR